MPASSSHNPHEKKIAVLIDGENVSYKLVDEIFDEVALLGRVTQRRVYGDFSLPQMSGWNSVASGFALHQIMQKHSSTGKNSSDIVLVIDAMDILHSQEVNAICIVSHDSDFTRLAMRVNEAGMEMIGMGERENGGQAFIKACSSFRYIEDKNNGVAVPALPPKTVFTALKNQAGKPPTKPPATPAASKNTASTKSTDAAELLAATDKLLQTIQSVVPQSAKLTRKNVALFIKRALSETSGEWLNIGHLGNLLRNKWPDFDPRPLYPPQAEASSKQLSAFLKTLPDFETKESNIRLKRPAPTPSPRA